MSTQSLPKIRKANRIFAQAFIDRDKLWTHLWSSHRFSTFFNVQSSDICCLFMVSHVNGCIIMTYNRPLLTPYNVQRWKNLLYEACLKKNMLTTTVVFNVIRSMFKKMLRTMVVFNVEWSMLCTTLKTTIVQSWLRTT